MRDRAVVAEIVSYNQECQQKYLGQGFKYGFILNGHVVQTQDQLICRFASRYWETVTLSHFQGINAG